MRLRVPINLASEPFLSTRRVVAGTVAAAVLLSASLALLISLSLMERGQADEMQRTLARLESEARALASERASLEAVLRRPENAAVLQRSLFLNELLYAKGISWTRLFDDLEKVMPHNVRLVSIRPQITGQNNQVLLDVVVGAQAEQPVIDFLVRLEKSPRFGRATLHNRMPPTQSEPLLRWRFSADYNQDLDASAPDAGQAAAASAAPATADEDRAAVPSPDGPSASSGPPVRPDATHQGIPHMMPAANAAAAAPSSAVPAGRRPAVGAILKGASR
ncbi:MAG: hypothetical protein ACM3ZB_12030 [bacterium]